MAENELGDGERVVALVRDLMFASRVRGAAPEAAVSQRAGDALAAVGRGTRLLIVELEAPESRSVIEGGVERGVERVVAFAPHVHEEALAAAKDAGAEVMVRGEFVRALPGLVAGLAG